MHFILTKGTTEKPRKQKSSRQKNKPRYSTKKCNELIPYLIQTSMPQTDLWKQPPRNMFNHFGFFSLAKYEPLSLEDRKEI